MESLDLATWRRAHEWTQREAADRLGVPLATYRGWEGGRTPDHPAVLRLAMQRLDDLHQDRPAA